jgi:protein-disulfide isomerase
MNQNGMNPVLGRLRCWALGIICTGILAALGQAAESDAAADGRSRGNPNAPVTLIEYSDFTCGFCVKFFRDTWPRLHDKYVQSGLVRFVYRDFPRAFQGPGLQAAVAARCAGDQGRYWPMHDRLFSAGRLLGAAEFERHASAVGLNLQAFSSCLREARSVDAIFRDRDEGTALGFRGTPGFIILRSNAPAGERPVSIPGAFPFEVFEEQIQRLLSLAKGKG